MLKEFINRYQTIIFMACLVFIALIGYFIYNSISTQGLRNIPIAVVPADAKIEINGAAVKPGVVALPKGTHSIVVSKEGFLTKTTPVTIEETVDYTNFEPILLAPVSDKAKQWVSDNQDQYGNLADSKTIIDPVFAYLPYGDLLINVSSESTTTPVTISAKSLGLYKNAPIDYLKRSGLNPSNYLYTYNYENPFKGGTNE